ncbi:MAG: Formate transporter FocA [Anaerolineales bacterium]|nr:Formate transporter FocA [Anaerolineales bacterium]
MNAGEIRIDALLPPEMALRAEYLGVRKAEAPLLATFTLALLAGAFISLGAVFSTTVAAGASGVVPYGMVRLLAGLVFTVGLVLVIVGGAELFTGNNLIVMAWAGGKVSSRGLLRNWGVVYAGNFVGAIGTVVLVFVSRQYTFGGGSVGTTALATAAAKVDYGFVQALALGVLCNALVCLAVWLTFSARSTIDRIAAIILPIAAFVAAGFEHSIANMYFIPIGLFIKGFDPSFTAASGVDVSRLTWQSFLLANLLPVTVGNIIGGAVLVAAVYWFVFLHRSER